jgi:hypothetical protein
MKYLIPVTLFLLSRAVIFYIFRLRGMDDIDGHGYVATANYLAQHGHLPTEFNELYRQFPGLSILMALLNPVIGNMTLTGHLLVIGCSIGSIVLMQYLFNDLRTTIIYVFFFYGFMNATSTYYIMSEAGVDACFLLCCAALLKSRPSSPLYWMGLFVGGFSVVIRQNAAFLIFPFIFVYTLANAPVTWRRVIWPNLVSLLPLVIYLAWNWVTIRELFPQAVLQHTMVHKIDMQFLGFSRDELFSPPFASIILGLGLSTVSLAKKINVALSLLLVAASLFCLYRRVRLGPQNRDFKLAASFLAGLGAYFIFHLCIGGISGFFFFDRYLSQASMIMTWALFYQTKFPWTGVALIALYFTFVACFSGLGPYPIHLFGK